MNTDQTARAAGADLRATTSVDVEAGLAALLAAPRPRPRSNRAVAALVAAAAVALAWWGGSTFGRHPSTLQPARPAICRAEGITCISPRTYDFALPATVRWHVPLGYKPMSGGGPGDVLVEIYSPGGGPASGVSVVEHVRAAAQSTRAAPARRVPATATSFIHWLAARPYLVASVPEATTFDGRPAWHVRVTLRKGTAAGPGTCDHQFSCRPLMYAPSTTLGVAGIWGDMVADYTALDLPGQGTAVVWSWSFGPDARAALQRNRALVEGISFPDH